ncbi:hypothetical protein A3860_03550 [Niastella vici]|uniref:Uncharacterized protein n=1 Tax=Niastella vici TaxID=1703345 RepID=A0A1V9FXK8_9BACT|nr:hypothetical protein [Niastella vici]OQP63060.1 hypothetical protein A3860_03550 [Niastella vici]
MQKDGFVARQKRPITGPKSGKNELKTGFSVKKSLPAAHLRHVKKGWASWALPYKTLADSGF